MRLICVLGFTLMPNVSFAHVGHLGEVAGHGHLIALGALVLAGLSAALGARLAGEGPDDDEISDGLREA